MSRADELYEVIRVANAELEQIRKACDHIGYHVGWYSWRLGSMEPRRICDVCHADIAEPSQLEINQFMAQEKLQRRKFLVDTYGPEQADVFEKEAPIFDLWTKEL